MPARVLLAAAVAIAIAAAGVIVAAAQGGPAGRELLPDLRQETPRDLEVTRAGGVWRLGFASAVSNVGEGPLRIAARRASTGEREMAGAQVVDRARGGPRRLRGAGRLRYVRSPDHQHWHLLGFERYELRRAGGGGRVVRDRKTGFCLGDRYPTPDVPAAKPARPAFTTSCGLGLPRLLGLQQGISVGFGDDYAATLEGQWIALDGLPAGRYVLTHRVDPERRLRERSRANNSASLPVVLRWVDGRPRVRADRG